MGGKAAEDGCKEIATQKETFGRCSSDARLNRKALLQRCGWAINCEFIGEPLQWISFDRNAKDVIARHFFASTFAYG